MIRGHLLNSFVNQARVCNTKYLYKFNNSIKNRIVCRRFSDKSSFISKYYQNVFRWIENIASKSITPFPIRLGLVFVATGFCTPIFIIGGAVHIWFRFLPRAYNQILRGLIIAVLGGGIIKISSDFVLPFIAQHGELILPFALANSAAATFYYGLAEAALGVDMMLKTISFSNSTSFLRNLPVSGSIIGVLTAITVPFLWPVAFKYCLNDEIYQLFFEENISQIQGYYDLILIPIAIPFGAVAGSLLQYTLSSVAIKNSNVTRNMSLPVLCSLTLISLSYYSFCRFPVHDYFWLERLDFKTGTSYSQNLKTLEISSDAIKHSTAKDFRDIEKFTAIIKSWSLWKRTSNQMEKPAIVKEYFLNESDRFDIRRSRDLNELQELYKYIDVLIRYKYLSEQVKKSRNIVESKKLLSILNKQASQTLRINNLSRFFDRSEQMIRFNRSKKVDVDNEDDWLRNLDSIKSGLKACMNYTAYDLEVSMFVDLYASNIHLLEDELKNKLNYDVGANSLSIMSVTGSLIFLSSIALIFVNLSHNFLK